jgi:diaminopimelate decarboxylase
VSSIAGAPAETGEMRAGCRGTAPLTARMETWQTAVCGQPARLAGWLEMYGSPLNLIDPSPIERNAGELQRAAERQGLDFKIFFARKANKALALVDEAARLGLGIDLASEPELRQTLNRGVPGRDLIMTAAIKPAALLARCVESETLIAIDNEDELGRLMILAQAHRGAIRVALRLAPELAGRPQTRFGLTREDALAMVDRRLPVADDSNITIEGVHFHLDGYDAGERVSALGEALALIDALRARGHRPTFIDMGGGIPISYLDSPAEWTTFWSEHRRSLVGERDPLTFEGHGLGLEVHGGEIIGRANVYPYYQERTRGEWLEQVLVAPLTGSRTDTVADAIRTRGLQLRCEPGRSLLDGCGLTVARVEFRKQRRDGTWMIGVAMNRTQCRSTSEDFLVDPLLLRVPNRPVAGDAAGPIEGYLVGAYCIERELLTLRKLRFPTGVEVGDIVVFPNTAGYMMHILESSSHQMPLARNLIVTPGREPFIDPIDLGRDALTAL